MDLSTLTPQQRACVEHVDGPLLVSAGAGSGKTFMLTQRIAYALLNPELSGVTDIDQVLAITFTEAAAAEIKSRVRNKLREEGMAEQALKVDACWISTIHGMCSRVLHENALELGLDPAFGLIDGLTKERMLAGCIDEAIRASRGQFDAFFDEYDKDEAHKMVLDLLGKAANVRAGLDSVAVAPVMPARDIAQEMYEAIVAVDAVARQDINSKGKQGTIAPKIRDMAEGEWGWRTFEGLSAKDDPSYRDVYQAICNIPTDLYRGKQEPFACAVAAFRQTIIQLRRECEMGLAQPARAALLDLARAVCGLYEQKKAAMGVLDQDDLINKTLDAFELVPEVEGRFRDRFRLIMVDEFQDTSELQIALISHLTDGDRRLCTVGDTQQSIYRFRGADVGTYLVHKRHMREMQGSGALVCELDRNFRSHGDIIRFVNRLFSQERVFGDDEFIKLGFDERHAEAPRNAFPEAPRIEVLATSSGSGRGTKNATGDDRVAYEAESIALRFCALHETASANCRWADMVILLGRMTNAEVYAQALRRHGAPCTITGGSGFKDTPEALLVASLCAVLANPLDNEAMGAVLSGEMFGLGTDELVALATSPEGRRRDFWQGIVGCTNAHTDRHGMWEGASRPASPDEAGARPEPAAHPSARVALAVAALRHGTTVAGSRGLSVALNEVAVESGYLARLQAQGPQGMAQAANFFKALRMVEGIEHDDPLAGPAEVCDTYERMIDGCITERPGSLNTDEQDAVRILTIHSSKGLEYPIVALADFNGSAGGRSNHLSLECAMGRLYVSLMPKESKPDVKAAPELTEAMVARLAESGQLEEPQPLASENATAGRRHDSIKAYHDAEELAEQRRKFYVGATRPREALVVAVNFADTARQLNRLDCINDLRSCLFGEDGAWRSAPEGIDYGGTTPAIVTYAKLVLDADGNVVAEEQEQAEQSADDSQPCPERAGCAQPGAGRRVTASLGAPQQAQAAQSGACLVPEAPMPGEFLSDLAPARLPYNPRRAATFSYSALAAHDKAAAEEDRQDIAGIEGVAVADLTENGPAGLPGTGGGRQGAECAASARQAMPAAAVPPHHASATAFGSALHQACQAMAEDLAWRKAQGAEGSATAFALPADERLRACLAAWDVPADELSSLKAACTLWLASDAAQEAASFRTLVPEAPFYAALQGTQGEPIHLEGAMDLLCHNGLAPQGKPRRAFIVDYKTGGLAVETAEELQAKHDLQARCYAYVALSQGFDEVELAFVRVEQPDPACPGKPQEVRYRFSRADVQPLHEHIRKCYARL